MNKDKLQKILEAHRKWADGCAKGSRADLYGADLRGANLRWANLRGANLYGADLRGADLRGANLRGADLYGVSLRGANLRGADLYGTSLYEANLRGADLREANLSEIKIDYLAVGIHPAPQGTLIAWGKKSGHIVKMEIPAEAKRSCATTRKFRAERVRVLEIDDGEITRVDHTSRQGAAGVVVYEVGKEVHADSWDDDRWNECSHGIHFFLTREEAEEWME